MEQPRVITAPVKERTPTEPKSRPSERPTASRNAVPKAVVDRPFEAGDVTRVEPRSLDSDEKVINMRKVKLF